MPEPLRSPLVPSTQGLGAGQPFASSAYSRALERVLAALEGREPLVVVTGARGAGKTLFSQSLVRLAGARTISALVPNPLATEDELLRSILRDFGLLSRGEPSGTSLPTVESGALVRVLNDFLLTLLPLDANAWLVFDEAHDLPLRVLRHLGALSRLEAANRGLLQIVLVGEPTLLREVGDRAAAGLAERIAVRCEIGPLADSELVAYLDHRWAAAGGVRPAGFSPAALEAVYRCSGGNPGLVAQLCDRALGAARARSMAEVAPSLVAEAATGLSLDVTAGSTSWWRRFLPVWSGAWARESSGPHGSP